MKGDHMHHQFEAAKGIGAVAVNALAIITSAQEHFEWALRCASLLVGISVGLLTLWSFLRNKRGRE